MISEAAIDRVADWVHRYGILVLTISALVYVDVEQSQPGARLFTKAAQRTGSQGGPKVIVDDLLVSPSLSAVRSALVSKGK